MADKRWYFNTKTEQPELGMISPSTHRMGPYKTRQDALDAWKIAKERNLTWDEVDRQWNKWDDEGKDDGDSGSVDAGRDTGRGDGGTAA
ncbi:hypothetical protein [Bifidobacterium leontopitheci]|uniref:Methionine aminopeptidase n=1 Tax=Bifidobacterium leontopitheci TaxID=2650774 RepID=A0A6I1GEZ6_9BIFI|nr:hypothetical protein [Bifidobacterium leontopitheci]KAB7790125.1 hypothetical protein F7D09_1387 [Bifidobacterium leontopitheci]